MINYFFIFFLFFCDFFVFSNSEAFICFFIFLGFCGLLVFSFNKFIQIVLFTFVSRYNNILILLYKLLGKFEYFDCFYKSVIFSFRDKILQVF